MDVRRLVINIYTETKYYQVNFILLVDTRCTDSFRPTILYRINGFLLDVAELNP
jgi:hypothetical protein